MLTQKLDGSVIISTGQLEGKKKKSPKVRIKCGPQFDTKSSKQQTFMLQKSKTALQKTGYPCHRKAGERVRQCFVKMGHRGFG